MEKEYKISTNIDLFFDMGIMDWEYKHNSPFEAYMDIGEKYFSKYPECDLDRLKKSLESQFVNGSAEQLIKIAGKQGRIIILGKGMK